MNKISRFFEYDYIGIELGTAKMRVWIKGEGLVMEEAAAVTLAISREEVESSSADVQRVRQDSKPRSKPREHRILAIGAAAGEMLGKTPCNLVAVRPFIGGVICDYDITKKVLRYCLTKVNRGKFRKPRVVIAVDHYATDVEKRALEWAAHSAGTGDVFLLESTMAAAIGAGLPVAEPKGCMVVDIGASMTNIAVVALAGIVHYRSLRVGGDEMNKAIMTYVRNKYNLLIGERDAEDIKIKIGTASKPETELDYEVKGIDVSKGRLLVVTVNSKEIREEAFAGALGQIEDALREFLAHIEPEFAADIADRGLALTGGGAFLTGLDKRLANATGLPIRVADTPAQATIRGVGVVIDELDFLSKNKRERKSFAS